MHFWTVFLSSPIFAVPPFPYGSALILKLTSLWLVSGKREILAKNMGTHKLQLFKVFPPGFSLFMKCKSLKFGRTIIFIVPAPSASH